MTTARRGADKLVLRGRRGLARQGKSVEVRIDPKRLARYERLLEEMERASRREAAGFDAFWEAVGEILDAELYVAGGFETPKAFVEQEVKEKVRTAQRNVRVATYSSPAEQERYGTALLDAALGYLEAKNGEPLGEKKPRYAKLRFAVMRNGKTRSLGLDEVTLDEVLSLTTKLREAAGRGRARKPPEQKVLADVVGKRKPLRGVQVGVGEGKARFGGVPLEALDALGEALIEAKPRVLEARTARDAK